MTTGIFLYIPSLYISHGEKFIRDFGQGFPNPSVLDIVNTNCGWHREIHCCSLFADIMTIVVPHKFPEYRY